MIESRWRIMILGVGLAMLPVLLAITVATIKREHQPSPSADETFAKLRWEDSGHLVDTLAGLKKGQRRWLRFNDGIEREITIVRLDAGYNCAVIFYIYPDEPGIKHIQNVNVQRLKAMTRPVDP